MTDETSVSATKTAPAAVTPSTTPPDPVKEPAKPVTKKAAKTTKPKAAPAAKAEDPKMVLRITAKPKTGFRRCGVHHPAEPVDYPADAFDAAQIAILKADASLVVEELT